MAEGKELEKIAKGLPASPDIRNRVLEAAGLTPSRMSSLLSTAVSTLESKLTAKETKFFQHQGEVQETREIEAHGIQLAAARELVDLVGQIAALEAKKNEGAKTKGPINVQVNVPSAPQSYEGRGVENEAHSSTH